MKPPKRYGVPYMGSKNSIAEWIVSHLPSAETLVDLFAGGCAVTHAALKSGKYKHIIANDLSDAPTLFKNALEGKYKDERRWISRDDFFRLKDRDPYVRYCWSFGNRGDSYLYSREIEPIRKAQWEMLFSPSVYERKIAMRHFIFEAWKAGYILCYNDKGHREDALPEPLKRKLEIIKETSDRDELKERGVLHSKKSLESLQSLESIRILESISRVDKLQSMSALESIQSVCEDKDEETLFDTSPTLEVMQKDYREVQIPANSVIYSDIPYRGTACYVDNKDTPFDYEAFYEWCERQTVPVFISEYEMPERFRVIAEREKVVTLSSTNNRKYQTERLFTLGGNDGNR